MALSKAKNMEEIDELSEIFQAMAALDIPCGGLLDQMKTRVREKLNQAPNKPNLSADQAFKVISDSVSMDKEKSLGLLNFYSEVEREITGLDDSFLDLLKTSEGDVLSKMRSRMKRMEKRDYVVLVAGERSAGKSSMLNLILGGERLPFSVLSTTSTICELKYGREKRITVHYKEGGRAPETRNLDESSSYIDQISEFVHVKSDSLREKPSDYEKVELFWPHEFLKDGVVIVDSPGIGESEIMDDILVNYLPNAFAFIYVINSGNAGGVQKDRLLRLLHKAKQLTTEQQMEFSPNCTLFVCNKWDNIPPAEANDVITHITYKLKQCLSDLDPDTQVIRFSTTRALMAQKFGIMNAEFASLMEKIGCLVTKSIEARLEHNWRWLDQLLSRAIWIMKAFRVAATQRLNEVEERLNKLQAEQESVKKDLTEYLNNKIAEASAALLTHLKNPAVIERFCKWHTYQLPVARGSWDDIESAINKLVQNRLQTVIEEWEEKQQHFAEARKSVVSCFLKRYNYLEKELQNVSGEMMTQNEVGSESRFKDLVETILTVVLVAIIVKVVAVSAGLGIVTAAGVSFVRDAFKKRSYKKNPSGFVKKVSQECIEKVATYEAIKPIVDDQLTQALICLRELEAKIPRLIEADMKLCEQLMVLSKKDTEALYKPRKEKCERLRCELGLFGCQEIRGIHIAWNDLAWDVAEEVLENSIPPGIYTGRISKGKYASSRQVTMKVYKELLTNSNVTEFLAVEENMRKLRHPHIVAFYGAAFRMVPRGLEVAFLMERSGENLKYYLIDQPGNCPHVNPLSTAHVLQWAEQIVDALMLIHSMFNGCVHGDLRLENVMLDQNHQNVKLSNICLTRHLTIEPRSKCDEFLHLPPEAIRNRAYIASSEIYCLGIMLWEMWYGKEAFLELTGQDLEVFLLNVEEGHRPDLKDLITPTSMRWSQLVNGCWSKNATERITLEGCKSAITEMLANHK